MNATNVDELADTLEAVASLVAGVRPDQWDAQTPCTEWTVRQLTNHMVLGLHVYAGALRAEPHTDDDLEPEGVDALGDDPAGAYRDAAADLISEFGRSGVLERIVEFPVGVIPAAAGVHMCAIENLVHGWDLARSTGQQALFQDDFVEQELAFSGAKLAELPPEERPFAPSQPVAADAPAIDRLAAQLGRSVAP